MSVSPLPSVMQQRMQTLKADDNPGTTPTTPASTNEPATPANSNEPATPANSNEPATPASNEPATPKEGERVTLSREEYNDLKANSGRAETLAGREQAANMERDEMRQRLTELENSTKDNSSAPNEPSAPAPAVMDPASIQFTEEEEEQYGETREYIEKIVDLRVANILNKLVPELNTAIAEAKKTAANAVGAVTQNNQRSFHEQLTTKVPELQTYIKHPQWSAFLDEKDPLSGFTYEDLISHHVGNQNLTHAAKVYEVFADKYVKPLPTNAGYAGASTGGGETSSNTDPSDNGAKMKFSDRKKAGEDYRMGRITYDQLQEVTTKFNAADKAGNVDYNS